MRWLALALLLAGCGSTAKPDEMDASVPDAKMPPLCSPPNGTTFFLDKLVMQSDLTNAFDIDGDGKPDNALGLLGLQVNDSFKMSISDGGTIYLMNFDGLDKPLTDGVQPKVRFLLGEDADRNPDDNSDADAGFNLGPEQYTVSCDFEGEVADVSKVSNGSLTGSMTRFTLQVPSTGSIEVDQVRLRFNIASDLSAFEGYVGFAWTACGMSKTPSPDGKSTMLDLILRFGLETPDVDLDKDRATGGPESIHRVDNADGSHTYECTQGGVSVEDLNCPCTKIGDGYSALFYGHGVPAQILDVVP